jgi:hypothetical protein
MNVSDEFGRMKMEEFAAYFMILFQNLSDGSTGKQRTWFRVSFFEAPEIEFSFTISHLWDFYLKMLKQVVKFWCKMSLLH